MEALPLKERSSVKFHHYTGEFLGEIRFKGLIFVRLISPVRSTEGSGSGEQPLPCAATVSYLRETSTGAVMGGGRVLLALFIRSVPYEEGRGCGIR